MGTGAAFDSELKDRLPLACATLELFDYAFDDGLLGRIYDEHRGRCYTDRLTFPALLRLVRDAPLQHGGSGHRLFVELERDGGEPADESNFYRKLARMPVGVSRALLRECTGRLAAVMPAPAERLLPACFEGLEVVVVDGKKVTRTRRSGSSRRAGTRASCWGPRRWSRCGSAAGWRWR